MSSLTAALDNNITIDAQRLFRPTVNWRVRHEAARSPDGWRKPEIWRSVRMQRLHVTNQSLEWICPLLVSARWRRQFHGSSVSAPSRLLKAPWGFRGCCWEYITNNRLYAYGHTRAAMSIPRASCGPVEGFVRPSLGFRCSKSKLPFDNLSLFW